MNPTRHPEQANWIALLISIALLLSGFSPPTTQAAPDASQATTIMASLRDCGSRETTEQTVANMIVGWYAVTY